MPKIDATTGVIAADEPLTVEPVVGPKDGDTTTGLVDGVTHTLTPVSAPDLDAGIKHLRTTDSGALRIWTVKGPKEVGGTISAVFLQDSSKVVLLHQLASGKFSVYEKVS